MLPRVAATTQVISSGNEVPTATIVIEITDSLMPQVRASDLAESRNRLPPNSNAPKAPKAITMSRAAWSLSYFVGSSAPVSSFEPRLL